MPPRTLDLPKPVARALAQEGLELRAPYQRRIFTNRDLDFDDIGAVGFDMDYTLGVYRQDAMDEISVQVTVDKLVERGYPEAIREIQGDPAFAIRGLVVDKKLGNLLKMDRHGYVGRAYHGKRRLVRKDRKAIYRAQRIGQERERFVHVDTLFSLPEVTIFAGLVEFIDERPELFGDEGPPTYERAWNDAREAIDEAHQDESIKARIKADPAAFFTLDDELPATIHKLRSAGKKVFLLTNSYFPYTNAVLTYLLGNRMTAYDDWRSYFDWMIVGSKKPSFFTDSSPFQEVEFPTGRMLGKPKAEPQRGKIYEGGNQGGLQHALGMHPDQVLYVGDHIFGDIVKSKKSSGWRTALIVEDLEHDLEVRRSFELTGEMIDHHSDLRHRLAEKIGTQRTLQRNLSRLKPDDLLAFGVESSDGQALLDQSRLAVRQELDRLKGHREENETLLAARDARIDAAFNPYWGSIFSERHDTSLFGAQVENYACVYTSRVSNFLYASPSGYFHAPVGRMPHWKKR